MIITLIRLWKNIDLKYKFQFIGLAFLLVLNAIVEIISIGSAIPFLAALSSFEKIYNNEYLHPIFELFNIETAIEAIGLFALTFGLSILLSCFIRLITLYATTKISFNIGTEIGTKIYSRILNQNYAYHIKSNSSVLLNSIILNSDRTLSVINSILIILSSSVILFAAIGMMTFINWKVTLVSLCGFSLSYIVVTIAIKKRLQLNGLTVNKESTNVIKCLQEGLGGIREVIVNNSFEVYIENYKKFEVPKRKALANNIMLGNTPKLILESIGMMLIVLVGYYLYIDLDGSLVVFPILGVIALTAQRLLPIMQQIYLGITTIISNRASLEETLAILDLNDPSTNSKDCSEVGLNYHNNIEMEGVFFRYSPTGKNVLNNVNFKMLKGDRVGLIGKTGGGKSTFIDLLMGLLEPTAGQLLIDGVPIDQINRRAWMAKISHVPQDIFLLDTTIIENIAFGIEKKLIDIERVNEASKMAGIYYEILDFKNGFSTVVGERGTRLSGGQKQRIGIARALYRRSEILIFDEATSALDLETESQIIDSILGIENKITIVMIAHRITTLKNCSYIYRIDNSQAIGPLSYENLVLNLNSEN
jgi:ABC-type multidrug transport system fused ATPase/permease subunit